MLYLSMGLYASKPTSSMKKHESCLLLCFVFAVSLFSLS